MENNPPHAELHQDHGQLFLLLMHQVHYCSGSWTNPIY